MIYFMNEEQQLRYLAGYIDGDGCFRANITSKKSGIVVYERSITVSSVKEDPIAIFKKTFGGFVYEEQKPGNRRKTYTWTVKGNTALLVAKRIKDFLIIKKNQCSNFIEYCENISFNSFKKVDLEILKKRNFLINSIRQDIHEFDLIEKIKIGNIKNSTNFIEPVSEDYIYLAGLIDAEGCFRVSKRFRKSSNSNIYNTVLEIGNTKITIIEWLYKRFKGSISYIKGSFDKKNSATWSIHSKSLYPIIINVIDYLINKKEVCFELIKFQQTILKNGGRRSSFSFKENYKVICQQRELIIEKIHALNHKGN